MTRIEAILFDKDGTLFDYHRTWANWSRELLVDLGGGDMALARRLGAAVGFDIDRRVFEEDSPLVREAHAEVARALLPLLPGASVTGIATRMAASSATAPQAEAVDLKALMGTLQDRGLILGVATNDSAGPTEAHLGEAGLAGMFRQVLVPDRGYRPKPAPDMLSAFCDLTGVDPARTVMVGDSAHDMTAARAAGMLAVAVLTGAAGRRHLDPLSDAVLDDVGGLPGWLDRVAARLDAA